MSAATLCVVAGIEPYGINQRERWHWRKRHAEKKRIADLLRIAWLMQCGQQSFKGKVRVEYQRSYRAQPMDEDNLASSFKAVGDALVKAGILVNDDPAHLQLKTSQVKRTPGKGPYFAIAVSSVL